MDADKIRYLVGQLLNKRHASCEANSAYLLLIEGHRDASPVEKEEIFRKVLSCIGDVDVNLIVK